VGSDLYAVTVESYREHGPREATARALAFGSNLESAEKLFGAEEAWVETRLCARSIHPDAPVAWDHVFVLRLLDELVLYGPSTDGQKYRYKDTPIARDLTAFWSMDPKVSGSAALPMLIVEVDVRWNSPPGARRNPMGDKVTLVSFVPKRWAPNIAKAKGGDSRAWSGPTWRECEAYPRVHAPRRALVFGLRRSLFVGAGGGGVRFGPSEVERFSTGKLPEAIQRIAPRPEGGVYVLSQDTLASVSRDGEVEVLLDVKKASGGGLGAALAVGAAGDVWIGTKKGVIVRHASGQTERVQGIKGATALAALGDGRMLIGTSGGLVVRSAEGEFSPVKDTDADAQSVWATEDGALWAQGSKGVSRVRPEGAVDKFGKRQGVDAVACAVPLPGGAVWLYSWSDTAVEIAPGSPGAVDSPLASGVAPEGVASVFAAQDGRTYLATRRGHIVCLEEGAPPACFVFENTCDELRARVSWMDFPHVCLDKSGDLYVATHAGLSIVRAAELEAARKRGALNADMPHFASIAPLALRASKEKEPAPSVDFQGKSVVLTGTLATMTRSEAQKLLAARGAVLSDSISKSTDYLIAGQKAGSKLAKAEKLGVKVLGEDALRAAAAAPAQVAAKKVSPFPHADEPGAPVGSLDAKFMRDLALSGEAIKKGEWKKLLERHRAFLDAGGAGGSFHSFGASGIVLAVYAGAGGGKPEDQANLQRRRLSEGFDAKKARLPYASGCAMLAEKVDFSGADLSHGNYTDAFFAGARFEGANLSGSDFSRADLSGACLRDADLSGADFENADLRGADCTGAKLDGARFPGAKLDGAIR